MTNSEIVFWEIIAVAVWLFYRDNKKDHED